jgi:hypothetical protein
MRLRGIEVLARGIRVAFPDDTFACFRRQFGVRKRLPGASNQGQKAL